MPSKLPRISARVSPAARKRIEAAARSAGLSVGRWAHRVILHALDENAKTGHQRVCVEIDLSTGDAKVIGASREGE